MKNFFPRPTALLLPMLALLLLFPGFAAAQAESREVPQEALQEEPQEEPRIDFQVEGLRVFWFGFVPTGLDVSITWELAPLLEGRESLLFLKFGGGYEEGILYRYADGTPITSTAGIQEERLLRRRPNGQLELGPIQGLRWSEALNRNLLESFLLYRGRYAYYYDAYQVTPYLFQSSEFTDSAGLFGNSLLAGLSYDSSVRNGHRVPRGIYAEGSAEWGPRWLGNSLYGTSDFYRFNLQARGYLPVFDLAPDRRLNLLAAYLGAMAAVDYSGGAEVPIYVMQSFGGRELRDGLAGSVRGFEARAYDTQFKGVINLEARLNGPAWGHPAFMPIAFLFLDAGAYAGGYSNLPEGSSFAREAGFLASLGTGAAIDVFGLARISATLGFPLYGERLDGAAWELRFDFGLHF